MKITMRPAGRYTGNSHKIVEEKLKDSSVSLRNSGNIAISVSIGPISTSGNFKGVIELPLSELHYLIGIIEEKKLKLLFEHEEERRADKTKASSK